ncbi:hypothetical protein EVG20_g7267 [Dentipellis fragilis]|uniref:Uncharacterized protein n=1 Tax=Dentipellis fragilis TaxID=205917 RepID=A0A4Y9YFS7_9AGAM|nr:hypothetical protein EVG20_g7267 [Dentipellis fragilis]
MSHTSLRSIREESDSQMIEASASANPAQAKEERRPTNDKNTRSLPGQQTNMTIRMEQERLNMEIEGLVSELSTSVCKADDPTERLETHHILESMQRCYGVEL